MQIRFETVYDPNLGCVAAAYDVETGELLATASAGVDECGIYMTVDEVNFYNKAGYLIPPPFLKGE